MTVMHFHYALVAHAISLSNSMCCYLASMASAEFTEFMYQTAYKNALVQLNRKKSKDKKLTLRAVCGVGGVHTLVS